MTFIDTPISNCRHIGHTCQIMARIIFSFARTANSSGALQKSLRNCIVSNATAISRTLGRQHRPWKSRSTNTFLMKRYHDLVSAGGNARSSLKKDLFLLLLCRGFSMFRDIGEKLSRPAQLDKNPLHHPGARGFTPPLNIPEVKRFWIRKRGGDFVPHLPGCVLRWSYQLHRLVVADNFPAAGFFYYDNISAYRAPVYFTGFLDVYHCDAPVFSVL